MGTGMNLDYEAMHSVAGKIRGEQQPLSEFAARMQSHIGELRNVWDSSAAQEFENTWNQIKPSLDKLHNELIPNIGSHIDTAADNYQAADDAAAAAARSN
jgi:WXG100 family type VII secretion target